MGQIIKTSTRAVLFFFFVNATGERIDCAQRSVLYHNAVVGDKNLHFSFKIAKASIFTELVQLRTL
jgi:hypothetical protein